MKRNKLFFWVLTGLLVPALGIGSMTAVLGDPDSVKVITSLGYPAYLAPFLGVARILALVTLLTPRFPRLKEWAYAGLSFDIVGAIYSQIATASPLTHIIFPVFALGLVLCSYYFYHRRLKNLNGQ